jgi:hypothetical protein
MKQVLEIEADKYTRQEVHTSAAPPAHTNAHILLCPAFLALISMVLMSYGDTGGSRVCFCADC